MRPLKKAERADGWTHGSVKVVILDGSNGKIDRVMVWSYCRKGLAVALAYGIENARENGKYSITHIQSGKYLAHKAPIMMSNLERTMVFARLLGDAFDWTTCQSRIIRHKPTRVRARRAIRAALAEYLKVYPGGGKKVQITYLVVAVAEGICTLVLLAGLGLMVERHYRQLHKQSVTAFSACIREQEILFYRSNLSGIRKILKQLSAEIDSSKDAGKLWTSNGKARFLVDQLSIVARDKPLISDIKSGVADGI